MMKRWMRQMLAAGAALALLASPCAAYAGSGADAALGADTAPAGRMTAATDSGESASPTPAREGQTVKLRVCNWEEYIDLGGWDEEETIDLESGDILGENSMVRDFEAWYEETYGVKVEVEYSTFGTNEDLYNMLTLGDVYDLVCPSEYMFMKLIAEKQVVPFSQHFFDETDSNNYYIRGVSPYIRDIFENHEIEGKAWSDYAAGYMWGITGIVYNPALVSREEASTWQILVNPKFRRQVTIKDNVRDSYFAAVGAVKHDLLTDPAFTGAPEYSKRLEEEMNDVSPKSIEAVQAFLHRARDNAYSFETDSGKADMVTGKVVANYQWSGDAVYSLDQAEEDDFILNFAVPEESSNIYFDGWVMLKTGIGDDSARQHAAEAFVNFLSRPDNAIRNMYYIGYTSVIAGGEDSRIFEYCDWCYGAEGDEEDEEAVEEEGTEEETDSDETAEEEDAGEEADSKDAEDIGEEENPDDAEDSAEEADSEDAEDSAEEELVEYPLGYFFSGDPEDEEYILTAEASQLDRQLGAQYPSEENISRTSIMIYYNASQNEAINQMWINVRCFNILDVPWWAWVLLVAALALTAAHLIRNHLHKKKLYS